MCLKELFCPFTRDALIYINVKQPNICAAPSSSQCCQLSDFVARFSNFSNPFSDFFFFLKRLATNLATFGKTLATFQMSPVLSCEREILSYTSPCVCSDQ